MIIMALLSIVKNKYHEFRKWLDYIHYRRMYGRILTEKRHKDKLRVLFFVMSVDMWKSNDLFKLLLEDPLFEPFIIPQLLQHNTREQRERIQYTLRDYFASLGFPFIDAIDFETGDVFDVNNFGADIIFCSQPYDSGLDEHKIKSIWHNVLFAYIPYCVHIEMNPAFYNGLYSNICWKYYCQFKLNKDYQSTLLFNKGESMVITGHSLFDQIENNRGKELCSWKDKEHRKIRLIWAPHHSILPTDVLGYSNFLEIANSMLEFATNHTDNIEIAFKPHPILKEKLIFFENWGPERTDDYYRFWKDSPNTILADGPYADLFMTSDAMVHDSSSFICEYIYTQKPVMFLSKNPEHIRHGLNYLGKSCFDLHYKGSTISDIEDFINEIVILGEDTMKEKRELFFHKELKQNSNGLVSKLIFNDMKKSLIV